MGLIDLNRYLVGLGKGAGLQFDWGSVGHRMILRYLSVLAIAYRLAWSDIRLSYRRSTLGPLWNSATLVLQISVIGILFSRLFSAELIPYLLHLGSGLIIWMAIVTALNEAATSIIGAASTLRQAPLSPMVFVLRALFKNLLIALHNLLALVPFFLFAPSYFGWNLAFGPVLLVATLVSIGWVGLLVAIASSRFRDLPSILQATLTVLFYVTPILWSVDQFEGTVVERIIEWNPFYHVVTVARNALLGELIPAPSIFYVLVFGALGWFFSLIIFSRFHRRIIFWI